MLILLALSSLLLSCLPEFRIWKMTDEIIVVQEEEQRKREQEYEQKLLDEEDIVGSIFNYSKTFISLDI